MLRLVQVIDQALGYVPPSLSSLPTASSSGHAHQHDHAAHHAHAPHPAFADSQPLSSALHTGTIQEKWVDHSSEWNQFEQDRWKAEGEWAAERATEASRKLAVERAKREQMAVDETGPSAAQPSS